MKSTKFLKNRTKALLLLTILLLVTRIMAAHNPKNYSITIITTEKEYNGYKIASLTDSTITIYKKGKASIDSIDSLVTLNARQIVLIKTSRPMGRILSYIIPIGVFTALGNYYGRIQDEEYQKQNSGKDFTLNGIYKLMDTSAGLLFGTLIAVIIDSGSDHQYNIYTHPANFIEFRKNFK